jgi:hypothetical protein
MSISSSGGLEVLQPLLRDGQLLHLSLHQLALPGHKSGHLVPQAGLLGQDLGTSALQSFLLPLEFNLTTFEADLMGAQDLKLVAQGDVVQLLPLLQL